MIPLHVFSLYSYLAHLHLRFHFSHWFHPYFYLWLSSTLFHKLLCSCSCVVSHALILLSFLHAPFFVSRFFLNSVTAALRFLLPLWAKANRFELSYSLTNAHFPYSSNSLSYSKDLKLLLCDRLCSIHPHDIFTFLSGTITNILMQNVRYLHFLRILWVTVSFFLWM